MLKKFFDKKRIFLLAVAVIATLVGVFLISQPVLADGSLTLSLSPLNPPSMVIPAGLEMSVTFIDFKVSGYVEIHSVMIAAKGFCADTDFETVSLAQGEAVVGTGQLQNGQIEFNFDPPISLQDQNQLFGIQTKIAKDAQAGDTFAMGIVDVYAPGSLVSMPIDGIWGNVMSIGSAEIGSLTVSAAPTEIPIYFPPISRAFLAEFQFEASLKEDIEMRELTVGFSAPGCEEWLDNFGLIDPASGMWIFGPVQVQAASPILLQGIFEIPKGEIRTLTAIADIEENAPGTRFNLSIFEIQARGLVFGFDVPVYGLPCTGPDVWLMVFPEFPSFYGWIRDLKTGNPIENVLIIAIREESKKRIKALSDSNGYYIFEDLEPGVYWLIAAQQGYRLNIQPALAEEGESTQIDFWLKSKK